jgi:hypothetical protein
MFGVKFIMEWVSGRLLIELLWNAVKNIKDGVALRLFKIVNHMLNIVVL